MRILLTNDDGINAEGIFVLAKTLQKEHDIMVVAPSEQRSACGHSITIYRPLTVKKVKINELDCECYSVDGTPADCVKIATNKLIEGKIDLVISGINDGLNLGTDVLYSGTVSAAIEAAIYNIPSIAISMDRGNGKINYNVAVRFIKEFISKLDVLCIWSDIVLNINVPNIDNEKIKGFKVCNLGTRIYSNCFIEKDAKELETVYEIKGEPIKNTKENTDVYFNSQGYITITPLHFDLTNFNLIKNIEERIKNSFKLNEGQL